MPLEPPDRPPELGALTSARFLAAMVVVLHHYSQIVPVPWAWAPLVIQGQAAVSFFFVLSGFILAYNYHETFREAVRPAAFASFYRARFARIFPLHALALVAITPLVLLGGPALTPGMMAGWWMDFAMVQALAPTMASIYAWNAPAWSISCEMVFYLALPFLVRGLAGRITGDRPALAWLAGLWLAGAILGLDVVWALRHLLAAWPESQLGAFVNMIHTFTPYTRGWDFAVGCVAGLWHVDARRRPEAHPWYHAIFGRAMGRHAVLATALGLASWLCFLRMPVDFFTGVLWLLGQYSLFVPCFAGMILALAGGRTLASGVMEHRGFRFLGEASYALYIIHLLPQYAFGHGLVPAFGEHPYESCLVAIAGSVLLSGLLHRWVETPARRWLRELAWPAVPNAVTE